MNISIIVLASPDKTTIRFNHVGNHIVNETMLIPKFFGFEVSLILFFVDFLEGVLESSIVFLQNGVFGGHVEGVVSLKGKLETAVSEFFNGLVGVVHA